MDLTRQGLWSNAFRALDVGMSGIGSPGWVVGCRVREEERVGGVSRTCEPISVSCSTSYLLGLPVVVAVVVVVLLLVVV